MRSNPQPTTMALLAKPSPCNNNELRKATRHLGQLFDDVFDPSGLRAAQHGLLAYIDAMDGPAMTALAQALVMDLSALGHTLKPLERDGFVVLAKDTEDRRVRRVRLTPKGQAKLQETIALWRDAQARVETVLGAERARVLRELLAVVGSDDFGVAFREGQALNSR